MEIKNFILKKNKQKPDLCFCYEQKIDKYKYSIFTINGGKTFLASIEEIRLDNKWYKIFIETKNSIQSCLDSFEFFINENKNV